TFSRGFKRGRVHGEGANAMSYVAKSSEEAQWLVAKGEDVVVIRGVEYKMLFKPWFTRAELEDRRRQEEETKFRVTAIRVPLRAMFHVPDLIQQSMGAIILQHPPEPDAARPKLMNLKFELSRDAEERFEPTLAMKLEDGELYNVELVCKNTSWCTRCRWWYHTESVGCPRAGEGEKATGFGASGGERDRNRGWNQGEVVFQRGIREEARDVAFPQGGARGTNLTGGGTRDVHLRAPRSGSHVASQNQGNGEQADARAATPPASRLAGTGGAGERVGGLPVGAGGAEHMGTAMTWGQYQGQGDPYLQLVQQNPMWQQPLLGGTPQGYWAGLGYPGMQYLNQYLGYLSQRSGEGLGRQPQGIGASQPGLLEEAG
ncbi:hypothetical protein CBR_g79697, partial [Chara braunii]